VGSHHFKVGGDVLRTTATDHWRRGYPGDVLHVLQNGVPKEVYLLQTPSLSESGVWTMSAYAMDSWQLNAKMTVNLGLRVDRYQAFLPAQVHPASRFNPTPQMFAAADDLIHWNVVAPRIGVAHDLTGDGKTLAKVSYARYWIAPGTDLGFNASPNASPWWRSYRWFDPDRSGVWEPGEEGSLLRSRGGLAMEGRDPQLQLPYMREVTASLERELPVGVGLRTVIVWRGERQHYMRQNANHPFDAFVVPEMLVDVGPDGTAGTADDGPPILARNLRADLAGLPPVNVVRNVPDADSRYWTWEVGATKRFDRRWSFAAGFAHTWSGDQSSAYFGQSVRNNMYPVSPNDLINAGKNGRYDFRTWSAKIHGTYQAPWDIRVTPFLRHQSGQPFGRTFVTDELNYAPSVRILAEPLESRRMDNVTLVDLRVEKGFHLRSGARVAAFVDTFNLLNANPEQNINWSSGESFLRPLNIVPPRLARVGARLEW
jgi:hypothetical protein